MPHPTGPLNPVFLTSHLAAPPVRIACCYLLLALTGAACQPTPNSPLHLVQRPADDACAYVSARGDTVIPFGRYPLCQTERFDKVALVLKPGVGWVGIDRQERVLFQAFIFDNGPDYPAEGVLRIVDAAGRIGYADSATGRVVLAPRYEAAFPFARGRARVGQGCRMVRDGEHSVWNCREWHDIDHHGHILPDSTR